MLSFSSSSKFNPYVFHIYRNSVINQLSNSIDSRRHYKILHADCNRFYSSSRFPRCNASGTLDLSHGLTKDC